MQRSERRARLVATLRDVTAIKAPDRIAAHGHPCRAGRESIIETSREAHDMEQLSSFAVTHRWPAQHPGRIQLYSLPMPNGVEVSIMLEEVELPYEPHLVRFEANDQKTPEFVSLNPNGKIPAILDPQGPGGKPLALFESGAILRYLADKSGQLLATDPALRYQTIQWLMPNGRHRSDVWSARLLPQVCRQGLRGQAPSTLSDRSAHGSHPGFAGRVGAARG